MDGMVAWHHANQKLIARNVVAELQPLWGILDFHALEESTPDWLRAVRPVIERGFLVSQYTALEFVKSYRQAVLPSADPLDFHLPNPLGLFGSQPIPDREVSVKIMVSMKVTGPVHVAHQTGSMPQEDALYAGFSKSSGAATRLVLNGGRGMVRQMADVDSAAVGIAGVVDPESCDICRALDKTFYKTDGPRAMDRVAVGHDFCRCSATLVYQ